MADRPILFSAPMVRAILAGRKSQTRRVLSPRWKDGANPKFTGWRADHVGGRSWQIVCTHVGANITIPYAPGDRLWVKEGFAHHHPAGVQEGRDTFECSAGIPGPPPVRYQGIYRADGDPIRVWHCSGHPYRTAVDPRDEIDAPFPEVCSEFPGWWSANEMKREWSRLTLLVTDVRVQRVQDISEEDIAAEGVKRGFSGGAHGEEGLYEDFSDLWDSLNGKRPGASWDENPWVAAYSFNVERTR